MKEFQSQLELQTRESRQNNEHVTTELERVAKRPTDLETAVRARAADLR